MPRYSLLAVIKSTNTRCNDSSTCINGNEKREAAKLTALGLLKRRKSGQRFRHIQLTTRIYSVKPLSRGIKKLKSTLTRLIRQRSVRQSGKLLQKSSPWETPVIMATEMEQ